MFCSNCGIEILEKGKFCLNCGRKLEDIMEETKRLNLNKANENKSIFNDNTLKTKDESNKKFDLDLIVRNLCAIFITRFLPHEYLGYVYLNEGTNKEYEKSVIANFKKFDGREKILCIFNTSILEVGRSGLVFTKTKIYVQNNNEPGDVILIKDINKVQYGKEDIEINGICLKTVPAPITKAIADSVLNIADNVKSKY